MIVGALLNVIAHDEEVLIVFGILMIFARDIGIICLKMEWRDIMRSIILSKAPTIIAITNSIKSL